jgi:mono/diheme cytochrome c family protein
MKYKVLFFLMLAIALVACSEATTPEPTVVPDNSTASEDNTMPMGGMGPGSGMRARHHATIPEEYAGMSNPVAADDASLERGEELYATNCATCHGDGGMGDGPAGKALDPGPAPIAHTSQMMGDDYMFWRINEGGAMEPFNSSMIAWKNVLDEQASWDVINYVKALGSGQVRPRQQMGGAAFDPAEELVQRQEMLADAVEQGVITQEEADTFAEVHAAMDELMASGMENMTGGMGQMQVTMLAELVNEGAITQIMADLFNDIHDRLLAAGLMQ